MNFNEKEGYRENPGEADKSAVCPINRHLRMSEVFVITP